MKGRNYGSANDDNIDVAPHSVDIKHSIQSKARESGGSSSSTEAAVNLTKLCIGSGILALPYAVQKGGLLLSPIFLALIAWWNYFSCIQMIECKHACVDKFVPSSISSTYSRIAYCASGSWGVWITDSCIIITLLGVCVTFVITFSTLLRSVPGGDILTTSQWAAVSAVLTFPACCSRDVSKLVKYSFLGLLCLLVGMCAISVFGVQLYGTAAMQTMQSVWDLPLWPATLADFATFIGIATFGYGTCSLAFPVEESMAFPQEFPKAAQWALVFVWGVYAVVGDVLAVLFVHDPHGVASNILRNLPLDAYSAHIVKLCMCAACLLTFPLTFIPGAQMLERLLRQELMSLSQLVGNTPVAQSNNGAHSAEYELNQNVVAIEKVLVGGLEAGQLTEASRLLLRDADGSALQPSSLRPEESDTTHSEGNNGENDVNTIPNNARIVHRLILVLMLQFISAHVPCFGLVVSLLGCFTVSILSFVLPPLFSLRIISAKAVDDRISESSDVAAGSYRRDLLLLILGLLTTVVATAIVIMQSIQSLSLEEC